MSSLQPHLNNIGTLQVRMNSTGQVDHADDVAGLDSTMQELYNNLEEDKINFARSATARQEFADRVAITRNNIEECEIRLAQLEESHLPSEDKVDKCEVSFLVGVG